MPLSIGDMGSLAMAFVMVSIVIAIGATILAGVQGTQTPNSVAYNITTQGLDGTEDLGDWLPYK